MIPCTLARCHECAQYAECWDPPDEELPTDTPRVPTVPNRSSAGCYELCIATGDIAYVEGRREAVAVADTTHAAAAAIDSALRLEWNKRPGVLSGNFYSFFSVEPDPSGVTITVADETILAWVKAQSFRGGDVPIRLVVSRGRRRGK